MEPIYPYLTRNLVRPDMSPIVVPDEAYDRALDSEWWNPYGVVRVDSKKDETPAVEETKRRGRPAKGAK